MLYKMKSKMGLPKITSRTRLMATFDSSFIAKKFLFLQSFCMVQSHVSSLTFVFGVYSAILSKLHAHATSLYFVQTSVGRSDWNTCESFLSEHAEYLVIHVYKYILSIHFRMKCVVLRCFKAFSCNC